MAREDAMDAMKRFEEKLKCVADGELIVGKLLKKWSRQSDLNR